MVRRRAAALPGAGAVQTGADPLPGAGRASPSESKAFLKDAHKPSVSKPEGRYWVESVCTDVKAPPGLKRRPMAENRLASVNTRSRPNFPAVAGYLSGTLKAM